MTQLFSVYIIRRSTSPEGVMRFHEHHDAERTVPRTYLTAKGAQRVADELQKSRFNYTDSSLAVLRMTPVLKEV